MLRKLNFTERERITRTHIHIAIRRNADGIMVFDPTLAFSELSAPSGARVYLEAYHGSSFMRFDCGTVGSFTPPEDRRLTEIDSSSVRFRVKIVDESQGGHQIVAVADNIRVFENDLAETARIPLLPVQFAATLGEQAWRVAFEADMPLLELNNRIEGIQKTAREDPLFFALVYPAAIRTILTQILLVDRYESFDEEDEWWGLWMKWAGLYASDPRPLDSDDAPRWIEEVVGAFCSRYAVVDRLHPKEAEG
jgi:hypothetical protein